MMLKLFLAALLTTATALPAEAVEPSPRIAGGTPATSGDFNFTVSIMLGGGHTCGGSLLGPDTVLTAAHCIQKGHAISTYRVRAGSLVRFRLALPCLGKITPCAGGSICS